MRVCDIRDKLLGQIGQAYSLNDPAHQVKHFDAVEKCGIIINERLGLGFDHKLIMMVAYIHDMFAWSRHNHHELSSLWVHTTDCEIITELSSSERHMVAAGCREHRASRKEDFSSVFAELMNAADREIPGDVTNMVDRAIAFRIARGFTYKDAVLPAIAHIKDKFGPGGYARYPDLYVRCFAEELDKQRQEIKNL